MFYSWAIKYVHVYILGDDKVSVLLIEPTLSAWQGIGVLKRLKMTVVGLAKKLSAIKLSKSLT